MGNAKENCNEMPPFGTRLAEIHGVGRERANPGIFLFTAHWVPVGAAAVESHLGLPVKTLNAMMLSLNYSAPKHLSYRWTSAWMK